jgi:hypothetical protein
MKAYGTGQVIADVVTIWKVIAGLVVVSDWFPSTNYMVIGVVGAIRKF